MSRPVAQSEPWTVGRLLNATRDFLASKGLEHPQLCAQLLLAHVLDCQRLDLYLRFDRQPDARQIDALRDLVRRSARHEPIAYLIGRKEFFGLDFRVTPDVLIPRPETETLVQAVLDLARTAGTPFQTILDLCTGCGCVAVALAVHLPACRLVATDVCKRTLKVADENLRRHALRDRIVLRQGDLFDALSGDQTGFDAIVANPPYVRSGDLAGLSPSVRNYEPSLALDGGPDGLKVIRRIVNEGMRRLRPGGWVALEVGYDQGPAVRGMLQAAGFVGVRSVRDGAGYERVVAGSRPQADAR